MTEEFYAVVRADGSFAWSDRGRQGDAALQVLEEGLRAVIIPREALLFNPPSLPLVKAFYKKKADAEADSFCLSLVTPGQTQMVRYKRKEELARAWLLNNALSVPMLDAEAAAKGISVAALVAEIIAIADQWNAIMDTVEPARIAAKLAIDAATTIPAVADAAVVNWAALLS